MCCINPPRPGNSCARAIIIEESISVLVLMYPLSQTVCGEGSGAGALWVSQNLLFLPQWERTNTNTYSRLLCKFKRCEWAKYTTMSEQKNEAGDGGQI